jgi:hypothetical protein
MLNGLRRAARALALTSALVGVGTGALAQQHPVAPAAPAAPAAQAKPPVVLTVLQPAPKPAAPKPAAPPTAIHTPTESRAALSDAAKKASVPTYVGANGRVYVNPHDASHLEAIEKATGPGSGVLQILQVQGVQHTLAAFEGSLVHLQFQNGSSNWRLRPWGDRLRPSTRFLSSAMIQLTPTEAANMRLRLASIVAEQGPEATAGPRWDAGHIKLSLGVPSFNCASGWCSMPIGEHGESVANIAGIPVMGEPFSLQRTLEASGSDRVFGIAVYGPKVPDFGKNPAAPQTKN